MKYFASVGELSDDSQCWLKYVKCIYMMANDDQNM